MKRLTICSVLWLVAVTAAAGSGPAIAGQVRAWGLDTNGQIESLPTGSTFTAIAAGDAHGLGLKADGTIVAWGRDSEHQCVVPPGTYRYVAAGVYFSLAIRTTGTLAAWGDNASGQVSQTPAGNNYVAVDGGEAFAIALKSDGSIVAWGSDTYGQVSKAPKGTGFKAVAAGDAHGVALRTNGSLVAWGDATAIQGTPTTGTFTAIAAGGTFCVALRSDGSLVWWGFQKYDYGLSRVPAGSDFTAVAAGYLHCLALRKDGSVVGWGAGTDDSGYPNLGQACPPAGKNYTALACGLYYSLALTGEPGSGGGGTPSTETGTSDNFDDNRQGGLWTVSAGDASACWLEETNGRLELRATSQSQLATAYYVSQGWTLDTTRDFAFQIAYHYGLTSDPLGWLSVGLTPDVNNVTPHHIEFGPGCSGLYSHVWYEAVETGERSEVDFVDRSGNSGVLYVSYDSKLDKLYLSTVSYDPRYAWHTVSGLLHGPWAGRPLWLYIGGGSNGQEIASGAAYLDSFAVDAGGSATLTLGPVHRLRSPVLQSYFYTTDASEKDRLLKEHPQLWAYDGVAFQAAVTGGVSGLVPVQQFWSLVGLGHFYTLDPSEKQTFTSNTKDWLPQGVAFYAYPDGAQPAASKPVYRLRRTGGEYFYTMDVAERDKLLKAKPQVYTSEGVAFYALPK